MLVGLAHRPAWSAGSRNGESCMRAACARSRTDGAGSGWSAASRASARPGWRRRARITWRRTGSARRGCVVLRTTGAPPFWPGISSSTSLARATRYTDNRRGRSRAGQVPAIRRVGDGDRESGGKPPLLLVWTTCTGPTRAPGDCWRRSGARSPPCRWSSCVPTATPSRARRRCARKSARNAISCWAGWLPTSWRPRCAWPRVPPSLTRSGGTARPHRWQPVLRRGGGPAASLRGPAWHLEPTCQPSCCRERCGRYSSGG